MKLVIDIGNSFSKLAVYEGKNMLEVRTVKKISIKEVKKITKYRKIRFAIISSVAAYSQKVRKYLKNKYILVELHHKTPLPIKNMYKTLKSLGKDRLSAAAGASSLFPGENVLVIDAGTCIKYDFISEHKEYLGGAISPGMDMRFKSLYFFTEKLPLYKPKQIDKLTGTTTEESILSGVIYGIVAEIDGIIDLYKAKYSSVKIILSGGNMNYFEKSLKNSIFAVSNIVLLGLNEILDYNAK